MGERSSYEPGTFCAVDLASSDFDGSKAFYTRLFRWEAQEMPPGHEDLVYVPFTLRDRMVAGMFERQVEEMPPAWASYVAVHDADATAARVPELGGTVLREPEEVGEAGRMAVVADPAGAAFALWQGRGFPGAGRVNEVGTFSLNQLNTNDPEGAKRFYGDLFGWRTEFLGTPETGSKDSASMPNPSQDYWGIYNGENMNGGMMPLPEASARPHWLVYFTSADLEASVETIGQLGGNVVVPPMPAGPGRIAVVEDPQGAFFALFEGEVDP